MQLSPIKFSIIGNQLSLNGVNTELMEGNSYPVEIETNEDLDKGYNLYIKPYGSQRVTSIGELINDPVRLVKVACTIVNNKTSTTIEKDYWGYLKAHSVEKEIQDGQEVQKKKYRAILLDYEPIEEPSVIPQKNKIVDYKTVEIGHIDFTYNQKKDTEKDIEKFEEPSLTLNNLKQDETATQYVYEILTDLDQVVLPPLVDGKLIVPNELTLTLNKNLSVLTSKLVEDLDSEIDDNNILDYDDGNDEIEEIVYEGEEGSVQIEEDFEEDEEDLDQIEEDSVQLEEDFEEDEEIEDFVEDARVVLTGNISLLEQKFTLSSYDSEDGVYIYNKEVSNYLIIINPNTDFGEITESSFTGIISVIFNEDNFGDYFVQLAGEIEITKGEEVINLSHLIEVDNNSFINDIIDYSKFDFNKEELLEIPQVAPPREFVNLYAAEIPSDYLTATINRFQLGVGKQNPNNSFSYSTNSINFSVYSSMINSNNWEFGDFVAPEKLYAIGYMDIENNQFFNSNTEGKKEIVGRTNVLYIDITETAGQTTAETVLKKLKYYAWEPFGGFYDVDSINTELS